MRVLILALLGLAITNVAIADCSGADRLHCCKMIENGKVDKAEEFCPTVGCDVNNASKFCNNGSGWDSWSKVS
jgi:ribosomal protein L14